MKATSRVTTLSVHKNTREKHKRLANDIRNRGAGE